MRPTLVLLLAFLALLTGPGCSTNGLRPLPGQSYQVADQIFFGTAMPNGRAVSLRQWQDFVVREVSPRFPKAMTSWDASGQWLTEAGELEHERSIVLFLVHPDNAQDDQDIRDIMAAYRRDFQQEAVLQVRSKVLVFLDDGKSGRHLSPER